MRLHDVRLPRTAAWILFALLCLLSRPCSAWGPEGHRTIAAIAALGLTDETKQKVCDLLDASPGQEAKRMAEVSTWADDVRGWHSKWLEARASNPGVPLEHASVAVPNDIKNKPIEKALARQFILDLVAHHGGDVQAAYDAQQNRHFTNLPLGTTSYNNATCGTGPNDCVQAILRCLRVLKGDPMAGEVMNRKQALRFLIHYVGDLHQPLHAGVGYWLPTSSTDPTARLATPAEAPTGVNDRGGNDLNFAGNDPAPDLHKLWDGEMVKGSRETHRGSESESFNTVAERFRAHLRTLIASAPPWGSTGSLSAKIKSWDVDSAKQSEIVYSTLITDQLEVKRTSPTKPYRLTKKLISLPDGYIVINRDIVNRQLARGAYRLAMALNSI